MRRLSFIVLSILFSLSAFAQQSPHGAQLKIDCSECHSTGSWQVNVLTNTFDHSSTEFSLQGQHSQIDCKMCHVSLAFSDEKGKTNCTSCHLDVHQQFLGNDCEQCHSSQTWIINDVKEIHLNSRFPLVGSHSNADCFDCHLSENLLQFRPIGIECFDCHRADYLATTSPNHQNAGYSTYCLDCHNMLSAEWSSVGSEHEFFPLTDGHSIDDCYACHTSGSYTTLFPECESCHLNNYNAALNPPHASNNFSVNCLECHTINPGWTPATFDIHNEFYILEGAHAIFANECLECHSAGYVNTPNTCNGCHAEDFNGTTDPSHLVNNFSTDCSECHSQSVWTPSTFDHNTVYVLEGAHAIIANECLECHSAGYVNTPNTCHACHTEEFNSTADPSHIESNFSTECAECHSQSAWTPSTFDHNTVYVIEGAHTIIAAECLECHSAGYVNTPNTCYACHTEEFIGAMDPPHLESNFSTDCTECHSQSVWTPSTFDHATVYVLEGAHAIIANECVECHSAGYVNTPNTCNGCHAEDYSSTTNPSHSANNFSTDCAECHSQSAWIPASFDHNAIYPLEGAHATIANDCLECHSAGYTNTPNTCYACHSEDFNGTTNPSHLASNFPTDCTECHSQNAWEPSTFDHDGLYFPIYSGEHKGEWNSCTDCHTITSNYALFTCIDCHEHNKTDMDDEHNDVSGYQYNSVSCLNCHPNGRAD